MYKPDAPADAFYASDQRWQLTISMCVAFGLLLVMLPLHFGFKDYYRWSALWAEGQPTPRFFVLVSQCSCLGGMLAVSQAHVQPWLYTLLQAVLSSTFCLIVRFE